MKRGFLFLLVLITFTAGVLAQCNSTQIDINSASADKLDNLYGIGSAKAQAIVDYRTNTVFNSVDDLTKVSGIGEVTLENIKQQGLACVSESNDSAVIENISQTTSGVQTETANTSVSDTSSVESPPPSTTPKEGQVIYLNSQSNSQNAVQANSKDINSENGALISGKNAIYGLFGFAAVILLLFGVKRMRKVKYRTEFD